ncbi:MAG: hypothetical protein AAFP80_10080, partial [Pseudomonadota bacterium]
DIAMAFDQSTRRSRHARQPTGKHIRFTERDTAILIQLFRYRYLNSKQLVALLKPQSEKRFVERLGDLFHETGLIGRPKAQWRFANAKCQSVFYELTDQGLRWLTQQGIQTDRVTLFSRRERPGVRTQFEHRLLVIAHLVTLELTTFESPNERFVTIDEILRRAPATVRDLPNPLAAPITLRPSAAFPELKRPYKTHIIPDAIYGIEKLIDGQKRYRFFAVEAERTSPKKRGQLDLSSSEKKQRLYAELHRQSIAQSHLGIPHLKLLLVHPPDRS